jgi:pimeloyl-ACP methyl ester carboxylesterase
MPAAALEHSQPVIIEGSVVSADGTRIAYRRLGTGPVLVFVHGSVSTHTDWMRVAKLLAPHYTCYTIDRRGRAHSGPGHSSYSLEREYEDIAAVIAQTGPVAALIGHSYGAICTLGAALRNPVPRLVVYEPPLPTGGPIAGEFLEPYKRAIAAIWIPPSKLASATSPASRIRQSHPCAPPRPGRACARWPTPGFANWKPWTRSTQPSTATPPSLAPS